MAAVSGFSSSAFLCARIAFASAAGRSCRMRRWNSFCLRFDSAANASCHSFFAATPRLPAARQAFSTSSGTENASCEMPSLSLAAFNSSAPSASPCAFAVPALFGAP